MKSLRTHRVRPRAPSKREPDTGGAHFSAFTIGELLIVVAVAGVLAALLVPSLSRARQSALSTKCAGSLRQFELAAQMYWDDHDGATFRYRRESTNGGDLFWFGWLERGEEGHRRFDPRQGALWPYLASREVAICPALRLNAPRFKPKAIGGAGGYGYNLQLSAPLDQPATRVGTTMRPAELAVFADAAQVNDFQAPATPEYPMLEEFYYVNLREPTAHFRHRVRASVAFVDGHVASEVMKAGSLDQRLPSAHVGRLRSEILAVP